MGDQDRIRQLEEALHTAGMALAEVAKWRRLQNRMFVEDHAIRAAHILIDGEDITSPATRFTATMVRVSARNGIKHSRLSTMTPEQVRAWPQDVAP